MEKEVDALNQTSLELNNKITELEQKLASATAGTPLDEFPNEGENDNDSSRILNDSINAEEPISSEDRVSHIDDINNQVRFQIARKYDQQKLIFKLFAEHAIKKIFTIVWIVDVPFLLFICA